MNTQILTAALAAVVVLLPFRSEAQTSVSAERMRGDSAQVVVGELLSHRQELSLTSGQVDSLTALATRIREDRGGCRSSGSIVCPASRCPDSCGSTPFNEKRECWRSAF